MAELPEMIGKYKIVSLVAKGGMGAVFKAIHPTLKRYVIIKKLTIKGNASVIERFKREAQILLDCNDPHIVKLYDYFKEGNSHYLVLEYVDGMSLDVLIKKRRYLSGELSLLIFLDACRALKYAHDNGIIHRDIKPGNILISKTGDVKLADFGIASTEEDQDNGLTKEGMTLGTPSYMPPEQFENSKNVDRRADIYSMGIMLYEMVTGKKPFPGNFAPDTIMMIQKGRYVKARKLNPDLRPIISDLIRKMVQPNPKKRYQDMGKIIHIVEKYQKLFRIEEIQGCLVDCMTVPNFEEPVFKMRTKKRVVFFLSLFFLAALAGASYWAWTGGYVHRYVLADRYGAVRIAVRLPSSLKTADEVFLKASLYENDRKDFPEADTSAVSFNLAKPSQDKDANSFLSNTLFVAPGAYRMKLLVEQRIYWYSFTVETLRSLEKKKLGEKLISISFDDVPSRPIEVKTEAFDAITGKNISAASIYTVLDNGMWLPLNSYPKERLLTGTVRKFRADSDGYYSELFSLKVYPYQDELRLHACLVPLPGKLSIVTGETHLRLYINGSQTVVTGGEDMKTDSLESYRGGNGTWTLPAGRYELEAVEGKVSARSAFIIVPDMVTSISIKNSNGRVTVEKE